MNSRERVLAVVVGVLILGIGGYFLQSRVSGWFTAGRSRIAKLESDLTRQKRLVAQSTKAANRLAELEQKSLPPEKDVARSAYQDWLLDQVEHAGLVDQQVNAVAARQQGDVYVQHTFSVNGKGTIAQLVALLHAFYDADYLHRIGKLTVRPLEKSKLLDVQLTIEALSIPTAPAATHLEARKSKRLVLPKLDDYTASIVGRNLFAPPNQPPKLASIAPPRAETNRMFELTAKASDPDALDKLTYSLSKTTAPEARIDATSGRLQWIPKNTGTFDFEITVTDDGFPPRPDVKSFSVTVSDPPPPLASGPRKLDFDDAKFTVLTAIIEVDGSGEVWLANRPRGQILKLREGQEFEIGSIKGVVSQIGMSDFVFESDGKSRRLSKGEILEQAPTIQ